MPSEPQTAAPAGAPAPVARARAGGSRGAAWYVEKLGPLIALAVLCAVVAALSPDFRRPENIRNIINQMSFVGIVAVGMTYVIILGGIDLSVGSVLVFSGVVADKAMAAMGGQGWGAAVVGAEIDR